MILKISAKQLIYMQIIYNCIAKFLITDIHFPSMINYVTDIINVCLLYLVLRKNQGIIKGKVVAPLFLVGCLLLISTISFFLDFTSPLLYLWSLRNIYRFFVFFYCCTQTLVVEDYYRILNLLEEIFIINVVICLYEYVVRGIKYDYLGGLFGNGTTGGNGPLNALMIIVSTYVIIEYVNKKKNMKEVLLIIVMCLFLSAVGELKFFYFEMIAIILFVLVFVTRNLKMLCFVLGICIVGAVSLHFYAILYPTNAGFLSLDFIQYYAMSNSYGSTTDINRLSAIQLIHEQFFNGNIKRIWFGLGMGNGESAQYSFLTSWFYRLHGDSVKYNWFSHAFMYVEAGYIGLILYVGIFLMIFMKAFLHRKSSDLMQFTAIIALLSMVLLVYNQTMRLETMGYTMFLLLAFPFITMNCQGDIE